jgi:multidrug efflux pump subunit AcrB
MPPVEGYGVTNDAEVVLQDRMARDPQALKAKADDVIGQLMQVPEVAYAYTMFRADYPQLELEVNEDKAKQLGVSIANLLGTVQTYFSETNLRTSQDSESSTESTSKLTGSSEWTSRHLTIFL